jgi:Tfp pilus assembly protein PilO
MRKNFSLAGKANFKDPRVSMRAVLGVLLLGNVAAALVLIKPFGGSADDLRRQQVSLAAQLSAAQGRLANTAKLVDKVQNARLAGDEFLGQYFMDAATSSSYILQELTNSAKEAGITMGQAQWSPEPIEGTESMFMLTTQVGFEGSYANLTKFVNLLDKSPRFIIIENMQAAAPQQQGGQKLNVTLKIDTFVKETPVASAAGGAL